MLRVIIATKMAIDFEKSMAEVRTLLCDSLWLEAERRSAITPLEPLVE